MERGTKDSGSMISKKGEDKKSGQMGLHTPAITKMAKNMGMASLSGQMGLSTLVGGRITKCMVRVRLNG